MKFVIFCHDVHTGGPFALLQLNKALNDLGCSSEMLFLDKADLNFLKNEGQFKVEYTDQIELSVDELDYDLCHQFGMDDVLIFPEMMVGVATKMYSLGHRKRIFWWLSWDNVPLIEIKKFSNHVSLNSCVHIFQSHYARAEANRLGFDGPIVSDYTLLAGQMAEPVQKTTDFCYLVTKSPGVESLIDSLINFTIMPIYNMDHGQVQKVLQNSKFFIDFGPQPGKDRIPREAVLNGCIPIVRKVGAACHFEDLPIPSYLKLETEILSDRNLLGQTLANLIENFEHVGSQLGPYVSRINKEKDVFYDQVAEFLTCNFGEETR